MSVEDMKKQPYLWVVTLCALRMWLSQVPPRGKRDNGFSGGEQVGQYTYKTCCRA